MRVVPLLAFHAMDVALGEALPPVRDVRELAARGALEVGILDLDGVVAADVLPQWVQALVAVSPVPVRFDGALHEGSRIERVARAGFASVVVDQSAVFDPLILRWALDMYGNRCVVEVKVDDAYVFDAPASAFGRELVDVLQDLHVQGARRVLWRDVTGTELPTREIIDTANRLPGMHFTYQGPVRSLLDIRRMAELGPIIEAVLVNASHVLDGELDLTRANRAAAASSDG